MSGGGFADILIKAFIDVLWRSLLKLRNFKSTNPRKAAMNALAMCIITVSHIQAIGILGVGFILLVMV